MDITTRIRGACVASADAEDMKAIVEKSKRVLAAAEQVSDLSKNLKNAGYVFRSANEALTKFGENLDKATELRADICALNDIYEAIRVLNQDGIIQKDGEAAARAFGQLLGGFGQLAKKLPPPFNVYAPVFEKCRGEFFNVLRKELRPAGSKEDWEATNAG